ncbi:tetratricopeptide repeat protein [Thorsellia kenyensis]|uniref:Tetratricopeptide repeat protein n=1 Tax=Thorsellia kenyensis TaxID=1549888 RepID=A0ABV6CA07_9GAMM
MFTEDEMNTRSFLNALIELKVFFDETKSKRRLSLSVNRLNVQINNLLSELESEYGPTPLGSIDKLALFLNVFYHQVAFEGINLKHTKFSNFLDVDFVIKNKIGHDFVLSALFCALIKDQGIIAKPIFLLGQILIRVEILGTPPLYIDAQSGEELPYRDIELMIKSQENVDDVDVSFLEPQETTYLVLVYLGVLKSAFIFEDSLELALKASNLMISLTPDDPFLRRDRGMILARLGCPQAAVNEFNFYLEKCPNDAMSEITKAQISAILPEPIALH